MGSIVSHIHDLLEEFGTWENYELMQAKKQRLDKVLSKIAELTDEHTAIRDCIRNGPKATAERLLDALVSSFVSNLAQHAVDLQAEISQGSATRPSKRRPGYQEHELKTLPEYYQQVISGQKRFEYRRNDRGYQVGDVLILREYILPDLTTPGGYTGAKCEAIVTCMLNCSSLEPGSDFVVLQIAPELL